MDELASVTYDPTLSGESIPPVPPPQKEVTMFVEAVFRMSQSGIAPASNPFRQWVNGALRKQWEAARQAWAAELAKLRPTTRFYVPLHEQPPTVEAAGLLAIQMWLERSELNRYNLPWLAHYLNKEFQGPRGTTRLGGPPRWRRITGLSGIRPWKFVYDDGAQKSSPKRKSGSYSGRGAEAYVLTIMGLSRGQISDHCGFTERTDVGKAAGAFARRIGAKWPLGRPVGRPLRNGGK